MIGRMGHHSARATPPPSVRSSRTARRLGALALAAISVAGVGCTKTNDAVTTAPASLPAATSAPATSPPGTTAPGTTPAKSGAPAETVPADQVDAYEATVTADGKDQKLTGAVFCRTLDDGQVRLIFGKEDDVDFRLTFPEDLEGDGTIELYDGDTKAGTGTASINAETVTTARGRGLGFGFSASFRFDSGEDTGTGTMTGSGVCAYMSKPDGTTTSSRPARPTTTRASRAPAPSRTLEIPAPDAMKLVEDLTALALESYVDEKSWRPGESWVAAGMPGEQVVGYGNVADGTKTIVSGYEVLVDKKTDNTYVAFAAADVNGGCAYGMVTVGDGVMPPYGTTKAADGPCSGVAAAKALGVDR